jgi:hypothetical protein
MSLRVGILVLCGLLGAGCPQLIFRNKLRTHELGSALALMTVTELVKGAVFLGLDGIHTLTTWFKDKFPLQMPSLHELRKHDKDPISRQFPSRFSKKSLSV